MREKENIAKIFILLNYRLGQNFITSYIKKYLSLSCTQVKYSKFDEMRYFCNTPYTSILPYFTRVREREIYFFFM